MNSRSFDVRGGPPRLVDVEGSGQPSDVFKRPVRIVTWRATSTRASSPHAALHGSPRTSVPLLGEQVGPDLVVVITAQQLATLGHQVVDPVNVQRRVRPLRRPWGPRSGQLELSAEWRPAVRRHHP